MKKRKSYFFLLALLILCMAYVAIFGVNIPLGVNDLVLKGAPSMRYGIDIRGGVEAVYVAKDLKRKPTSDELESARLTIENRLDQKNILDRDVTIDKENGYVLVRFPWKSDEKDFNPQQAIAELGETAKLMFKEPNGKIVIEGKHVIKSYAAMDNQAGGYVVSLELNAEGAKLFSEATGRLVDQPIAIYMDETKISAPNVNEKITDGKAQISGSFSAMEAKALSDKINAGALPFSMVTRNHSSISPTLGSGALETMVKAGLLAFGAICLFLLLYYRLTGLVACLALVMQTAGQLLALSLPQITLTLPGIAGLILSIGMGIDANVIIAERIREELKSGKGLDAAITSGFKRAFSSVFDGNITVMIVAIILMTFGSGAMLSFAYSLLTGVILNFAAGVSASRLMIRSLSLFKPFRKPAIFIRGGSKT